MTLMPKKSLHVIIHGRVQGVSFRWHVLREAAALELTGFVRNDSDGSVGAVFEGEEDALKKILGFCRKGPPGARVEAVEADWKNYSGEFEGFEVRN